MAPEEKTESADVFDPGQIEEHGVTIPVPTPSGINLPNPWGPNGASGSSQTGSDEPAPSDRSTPDQD